MNKILRRVGLLICTLASLLIPTPGLAATIGDALQQQLASTGSYDFIPVIIQFNGDIRQQRLLQQLRRSIKHQLRSDPTLSRAARKRLRRQLRAQVVRTLRQQLNSAKGDLDALLNFSSAQKIRELWLINAVALEIPAYMIEVLALLPQIDTIRLDSSISAPGQAYTPPSPPEWNVSSINVPALWQQGILGAGVVVAIIDTGVDGSHPDLAPRFRGGLHDWLDLHGTSSQPSDGFGHGTNAAGLILAGDSSGVALGMAPAAQWIAARVFDATGFGTLSDLHAGLQWALDPDGDPDTDDAPDIVNNSWGLLETVASCNYEFQADIQALKDSDIAVTFAAGNAGPNPDSSLSPANLPGVLSVGALNEQLEVARSSSRGPSACDATAAFPTVSAPGIDVQTTGLTFGTGQAVTEWVGGSSFAVAHVSGVLALLKSAIPEASVEQLEQAITATSIDLDLPGVDHNSGNGMIDAEAAYLRLHELTQPVPNTAPTGIKDKVHSKPNRAITIAVLDNDIDAEGNIDPASVWITKRPSKGGQARANADGTVTYTPQTGFRGWEVFQYRVSDLGGLHSRWTKVAVRVR